MLEQFRVKERAVAEAHARIKMVRGGHAPGSVASSLTACRTEDALQHSHAPPHHQHHHH